MDASAIAFSHRLKLRGCVHDEAIKDGKVWVQYNGTELAIAQILMGKGVPASDIVLGFHTPFKRQFSGYAVM